VAAQPQGGREPLEPAGRADEPVAGDGVVGCVVEEMGPLVDIVGPGLDHLLPAALTANTGDPARGQHPHNLVHRHLAGLFDDNQVDEVLSIGQGRPGMEFCRDGAINPLCPDVVSGLPDLFGVGVEAVDGVSVVGAQCRREPAFAAAQVHNDSSLDTRELEHLSGQDRRVVSCLKVCRAEKRKRRTQNQR